jgi:TP901 family phage tail tape measure protein
VASGQVVVHIVGNSAQLSAALGKAAGDLDGFAGKAQAMSQRVTSVGKSMTMGLTLPIVGIGFVAFKAAQDFESAWAGVTKTVDGSLLQMIALKQGIIDMAKEVPATTTEIAAIAEAAGALGIQTDAVLGFTRVMVDLGETTDLTADQAANAFARIANIMQTPQDRFDEMGSTVVDLGNKMAATESEITEMALRIAGAGQTVGLTEQEVLGFGAALASVGIEAEMGGSAISRTFLEMSAAAAEGGDAIAGFAAVAGQSADEFAEKFKTAPAAAMVDFIGGLRNIQDQGGNLMTTLDELGITEMRQRDTILRLVGAGGLLNDALATSNQAWADNTALTDEAQKRYDTGAAKMDVLKNRLADVARQMGEILVPIIERVAEWFAKLIEKFRELDPSTQKWILAILGLVAALGPLVVVIGLLMNPITWVILGLAALVTAAVMVWTKWDEIWNWIVNHPAYAILIAILAMPVAAFVVLIGVLKWVAENWDAIWYQIGAVLQGVYDTLIAPAIGAIGWGIAAAKTILEALRDAWNEIWPAIGPVIKTAAAIIMAALGPVIAALDRIIDLAHRVRDALDLGGGGVSGAAEKAEQRYYDSQQGPPRARAKGGPVQAGEPYIVGEEGPELFVPLQSGGIVPNGGSRGGSAGGLATLVIPVQIDGKVVTEVVVSHLNRAGGPKVTQKAIV